MKNILSFDSLDLMERIEISFNLALKVTFLVLACLYVSFITSYMPKNTLENI